MATDRNDAPGDVLVMGAGAIGLFVGGRLQAAGASVTFVGRPRVVESLCEHGLRLTDLDGGDERLRADALNLAASIPAGARPALVLLAVKSGATPEAATLLADRLPAGTTVVSLQNGIGNADVARRAAPMLRVVAGMVPFNVVERAPGHFHRATAPNEIHAADDPTLREWRSVFARAGLALHLHADLRPVQWAKLLLNLNNPVNALSGLPLRAQLMDRGHRRVLAAAQGEALAALRAAKIEPARIAPLPMPWLPALLRLPTPLFRVAAARMLRIDAAARSSMADDFARGRATEVDALCGEVVRLASAHGLAAPVNAGLQGLVEAWPASAGKKWSGSELVRELGADEGPTTRPAR